ncbi:MAG: vanadium-dependent haloperoxidase [Pseudomonadota bacterium]
MKHYRTHPLPALVVAAAACLAAPALQADAVTDWNAKAAAAVAAAKLPPHPSYRAMAMTQMAVYEAVNAITRRYPQGRVKLEADANASVDAAIAEANRVMLSKLVPGQQAAIDSAYQAALSSVPAGPARDAGRAAGEQAAAAVLAWRADDGAATPESYRPLTSPGRYVPTVTPAFPQWPQRTPWVMARADQFRPGPPPSLKSARWARDFNEIKVIGARDSAQRSAAQSDIARFWEATGPGIYFPVARSIADAPGREITQNARLLALAGIAMDDALTAVMDAKYRYHFWRPVTAIRNGDVDGNAATARAAAWLPFIDTPMHPEYPCAHCSLAGSLGAVLKAEVGAGPVPRLTTTSPTANGAVRSWTTIEGFVQEVSEARIYDGVHFRTSTEVGTELGRKIGELAVGSPALARN